MKGKYDFNPLQKFYNILSESVYYFLNKDYEKNFSQIESLEKTILMNNSCEFSNISYKKSYEYDNDLSILFITGALGNTVNKYFDILSLNGMTYMVIFLDSFKGLKDEPSNTFMGRSVYFDIIIKLVNIFISLTNNPALFTNTFSTTSAMFNYRYAPYIIAGKLIMRITGELTENDISMIQLPELLDLMNNNLSLYGIHK